LSGTQSEGSSSSTSKTPLAIFEAVVRCRIAQYLLRPEAKSFGPDGESCEADTRGLLQRAHIVANWPPIYIGKESNKHWEEGEDLSLLEFKTIVYKRKGFAVMTDEQLARLAKVPKREFMRRRINQHTLEKICNREPVRAEKLAKCLKVLEEYEEEEVQKCTTAKRMTVHAIQKSRT
jgi:hypothetical protein